MRKIIMLLSLFLVLIIPLATATLVGTTGSLKIISLRYEPYPVEPGSYFTMWIKLENSGVAKADDVSFELLPDFPFSMDEDSLKSIGKLDIGDEIVLEYKIRVDKDAVVGKNELKSIYCIQKGLCVRHKFNISVQARDAILAIADVIAVPSEIAPGEEALVKIKLNNIAESLMKDIRVKLDLYEKLTTAASVTFNELPFTPIGSTNEIALDKLDKGGEEEVVFRLIADPDAEPDVYKVPVIITYADEVGKNYTRNYITALIINDEPNIYATIEETTIGKGGGSGIVDIKFINKGLSDVKFLDVELKESDDYDLLSSKMEYIGNLDSDDYETAEFKLSVKKTKEEVVNLLLNIKYRDAINNEYEEDIEVPLYLYASSGNGKSRFGIGQVIFILIIVAVGILFYWRWKKKKRKK